MPRIFLGSWRCPSNNSVDAYLVGGELALGWDSPPPLTPADLAFYLAVIVPELTRRVQEYLEKPGRALLVLA